MCFPELLPICLDAIIRYGVACRAFRQSIKCSLSLSLFSYAGAVGARPFVGKWLIVFDFRPE